ncbi:T9SS type B sorting domain-containing protein [Maribacter sp. IgM3_T14_3]|uniref:T9SS type B sorting domain-containing protein n=1 Tax=Maribacter sp. IgM3_T14_3 TaxID=3415140 RepID=UPI003C704277
MNTLLSFIVLFLFWINYSYTQISVVSITNATRDEGAILVHRVTLSETTTEDIELSFSFRHISTNFGGNSSDIEFAGFPDGVHFPQTTVTTGTTIEQQTFIIVPAGIKTFTFEVGSVQDDIEEIDEQYEVSFDGMVATGTIGDVNDANITSILSVEDIIEIEGGALIHEIVLSNAIAKEITFEFSILDITTDATDYNDVLFSDGITYNESNQLVSIPLISEGIERFTITIPSIDDLIIEEDEFYELILDNISATGTILDNDTTTITSINDATEIEGSDLVHTVQLSNTNLEQKTFMFAIFDNTTSTSDYGTFLFNNGVTFNVTTGLITVPPSISSFLVTIPSIDDFFDEDDETYNLQIEDFSIIGTIIDNDTFTFPKFFTPNADGIHDMWPYDLVENNYIYENSVIYIFSRYGQLLEQLSPSSNGWDGMFNNVEMPSDDYWFKIVWEDGEMHTGHFTLKR